MMIKTELEITAEKHNSTRTDIHQTHSQTHTTRTHRHTPHALRNTLHAPHTPCTDNQETQKDLSHILLSPALYLTHRDTHTLKIHTHTLIHIYTNTNRKHLMLE